MSRRVKDYVDVEDQLSIDVLIERLTAIRNGLPEGSDAELRLRGDEIFGHRITISYFRAQTKEEAEIEKRYSDEAREAKERELARLQAELGVVCYAAPRKRGKLRIVA
jgi:hypothetical protein